jgi:hypothetical protein
MEMCRTVNADSTTTFRRLVAATVVVEVVVIRRVPLLSCVEAAAAFNTIPDDDVTYSAPPFPSIIVRAKGPPER